MMTTTEALGHDLDCHHDDAVDVVNQTCHGEDHHDHEDESSSAVRIGVASVAILLAVFISVGNLNTLVAVRRCRKLQTIPNMYVCSLAVADFLVGQVLFVQGVSNLLNSGLPAEHKKYFCLFNMSLVFASVAASMFSTSLVGCDRYVFIRHPLRYESLVTRKRSLACIVVAWFLALAYGSVPLYWNQYHSSEGCTPTHIFAVEYMMIFHPFMFLSLSALTFTFYVRICRTALKQYNRIHAQRSTLRDQASSATFGTSEDTRTRSSNDGIDQTIQNSKQREFHNRMKKRDTFEHRQKPRGRQLVIVQEQHVAPDHALQRETTTVISLSRETLNQYNNDHIKQQGGIDCLKNGHSQEQNQQQQQQQQFHLQQPQHLQNQQQLQAEQQQQQHQPGYLHTSNEHEQQHGMQYPAQHCHNHPAQTPASTTKSMSRSTWKMVKMLILVFGLFFLSWCPLLIVGYLEYTVHVAHLALSLCGLVGMLNSGMNCLVLIAMNRDFRREFKRLFCRCLPSIPRSD